MKFYFRLSKISTRFLLLSAFFIFKLFTANTCESQISTLPATDLTGNLRSARNDLLSLSEQRKLSSNPTGISKFRMKKDPWKAVAFSAIIPGSGQLYNESYWKVPIVWGLGAYFGYELIQNNNKYADYKEQYENSQTPENPQGDPNLQALRELYRDRRDNFIIYSAILYVVNLVDAYVDAQLYDFNVSDKIKVGLADKRSLINLKVHF